MGVAAGKFSCYLLWRYFEVEDNLSSYLSLCFPVFCDEMKIIYTCAAIDHGWQQRLIFMFSKSSSSLNLRVSIYAFSLVVREMEEKGGRH
ncbi:hypothetical protein Dimus_020999 [Dionaea muscipula]